MKDFIENWKTDSRFKTKIKLGLYTLFIILVALFAFSNNPDPGLDSNENSYGENSTGETSEKEYIELPEKYNYVIDVKINESNYKFEGSKTKEKETIKKINNDIENNYIYENSNYYQDDEGVYIATTKEKVYEPIKKSYIDFDIINQYLSKSKKENNKHIVYLKDIILGNNSDEYITITISKDVLNNKKNINIDYTMLMKYFDNNTETYIVNIEIE